VDVDSGDEDEMMLIVDLSARVAVDFATARTILKEDKRQSCW
jgi:hypothetical protein